MTGAISLARLTAFRQWWRSHMSQTMKAVSLVFHEAGVSMRRNLPSASTLERSRRFSLPDSSKPQAARAGASTARVTTAARACPRGHR